MAQSNPQFAVIRPGMFTTVQDLGRTGYQQYGMVVSGAMDSFALRVGNLLVGNEQGAAGLEITITGPQLRVLDDCLIAVTGADLSPEVDGRKLPMWQSVFVQRGAQLRFGQAKRGCRAYLTVRGGIDVPVVMGSRSTYVTAGLGGFEGRPLRAGDVLCAGGDRRDPVRYLKECRPFSNRRLAPALLPEYGSPVTARVILGPQADAFLPESIERFLTQPYTIGSQSNRMGYRLQGGKLRHKKTADIVTDAVAFGSIQVPADGDPIILLADRQTSGGYAKIATIITVDLPLVAQAKPGDQICFREITLAESQQLLIAQEKMLQFIEIANTI